MDEKEGSKPKVSSVIELTLVGLGLAPLFLAVGLINLNIILKVGILILVLTTESQYWSLSSRGTLIFINAGPKYVGVVSLCFLFSRMNLVWQVQNRVWLFEIQTELVNFAQVLGLQILRLDAFSLPAKNSFCHVFT